MHLSRPHAQQFLHQHEHRFEHGFAFRRQRQFGFGFPYAPFGFGFPVAGSGAPVAIEQYFAAPDGGYSQSPSSEFEPNTYAGAAPRVIYVPLYPVRSGCSTQSQTVPSESGEERTINIVRC
jgi:hypothetical protein